MLLLPHLETNLTIACQHRCIACNHLVAVQEHRFKESMIQPRVLARDLRNFARIAHVEGWAAIGGEPLLHPRIVELLQIAKASGVADRIEVWTNGANLVDFIDNNQFWEPIDMIVLSAYPGKITDDEIELAESECKERGKWFELKDERYYPNFSRLLEPTPTDAATTAVKYRDCWFKTYSRVLDNGYLYRCCTSPFIAPLILGLPWGSDGLSITEATTEDDVRRFLDDPNPLAGCTVCAGRNTVGAVPIAWKEVRDPTEWLEVSSGRKQ